MKPGPKPIPIINRFEKKIFYSPDGCWYWIGAIHKDGYGLILVNDGKLKLAHRVSYKIYKGEIGDKCVCHSCDNPYCVNPDHLWLGTNADNVKDRDMKGRGAPLDGINNPAAILDDLQVLVIRELLNNGLNRRIIASYFRVKPVTIDKIRTRETWSHL